MRVKGNATKKYSKATVVSISTGLAVVFDTFWPTYIKSLMPTVETRALSLNKLTELDSNVGIAILADCGKTMYLTF
jgi:hypothetical protein